MTTTKTETRDATGSRARIGDQVDRWRERLVALSHSLHAEPETCFAEHASAEKVAALLESAGFAVERGVCDLPTALSATYGEGDLTIGICAEYDALPEIGHACGHNIIAAAAAGAAISLAAVAQEHGIRVKVLGTPAEEGGGGKILMLERGAFDDVTVAMMVHPGPSVDLVDPAFTSLANSRFEVVFHGRSSHAAGAPELGLNAADAAVIAQVAIGMLRQQIKDGFRVAGIVSDGGLRPNIIPERAVLEYEVRTNSSDELAVLKERVLNCFRAAALATGTTMEVGSAHPDYADLRQDPWLANAYGRNIAATGRTPTEVPLGAKGGSTDMGNISHVMPSIHPILGVLGAHGNPHSSEFTAETNTPAADDAVCDGAKAMAWTALDLALDPVQRAAYLAKHAERANALQADGS
jgi:amidohydrolase